MAEIGARNTFGMPRQKLKESEKTEEWGKQCVDSVINMSGQLLYNGRSTQYHKQINYDLVNGLFNENDMKYVTDPYGINHLYGNQPATMVCYPIIPAKLNLLDGEELGRPFNFRAICTGGDGVEARQKKKMDLILKYYQNKLYDELGITPEQAQDPNFQTPHDISKWVDEKYMDVREELANAILKYIKYEQDFKWKFNKGFKHAKICAEEVYYVGQQRGKPIVRVVNPLYFDFDRNPEIEFIEDSQWAKEERYMAVGQIIDEYSEYLTDEQIDMIESGNFGFGFSNQQALASATMTFVPYDPYYDPRFPRRTEFLSRHSGIPVITTVWKSLKKTGFLTYTDQNGEEQQTIVDENFKLTPELKSLNAKLEWEWRPEIWEGTRIGSELYVNIRPLPNQVYDKIPYVGGIYNNLNSIATSLVDYMKPHQYLYNIVWYRLELELAKAKGKKFIMDMAQLPKSQGWDEEKWMYYFDNLGIAWINSAEEGIDGPAAQQISKYNQFTSIDMTLSQSVQQYLGILSKLEDMVGELVGVTRQREGQIATSETVGGTERSIVQSSLITEPLFIKHNQVKQRVITQLLAVAKLSYQEGGRIDFLDDDLIRTVIEIDGDLLNDSDYGVFITDATVENAVFDKLQSLAQEALRAQAITFSDLITIFKSQSLSEVERTIKQSEASKMQQEVQQQQSQQQAEMQMEQMKQAEADKQRQWESVEKQKDRDARIQEAEVKTLGFEKDQDMNKNNIPDVIDQADLILRQREQEHSQFLQTQKQNDDAIARARKDQLDKRKLEIENKKIDMQAKTTKQNLEHQDRKIQMEQSKHAMDIAIKKKELEAKSKEVETKKLEHKHKIAESAMDMKSKVIDHQASIEQSKQKIKESQAKAKLLKTQSKYKPKKKNG